MSLNGVFSVGDDERDIVAARACGARPVLLLTGHGRRVVKRSKQLGGVPVYDDLAAFADALLSGELRATS